MEAKVLVSLFLPATWENSLKFGRWDGRKRTGRRVQNETVSGALGHGLVWGATQRKVDEVGEG
jgi:hypothetical protein